MKTRDEFLGLHVVPYGYNTGKLFINMQNMLIAFEKSGYTKGKLKIIEVKSIELEKEIAKLQEKVKVYEEALEFYGNGNHFEYCGIDEYEPENISGEPNNWLCGGEENSAFQYEDGWIARQVLQQFKGGK